VYKKELDQASCSYSHTDQPCSFQLQKHNLSENQEEPESTQPDFSSLADPQSGLTALCLPQDKDLSAPGNENETRKDCANEIDNKACSQNTMVKSQIINKKTKRQSCDVCGKSFISTGNLKQHKLIHTGPERKSHVCDVCNKAFTQASHLKQHKLIHTGQKNHVCDVCNKAFTEAGHLKRHKLVHTGKETNQV